MTLDCFVSDFDIAKQVLENTLIDTNQGDYENFFKLDEEFWKLEFPYKYGHTEKMVECLSSILIIH